MKHKDLKQFKPGQEVTITIRCKLTNAEAPLSQHALCIATSSGWPDIQIHNEIVSHIELTRMLLPPNWRWHHTFFDTAVRDDLGCTVVWEDVGWEDVSSGGQFSIQFQAGARQAAIPSCVLDAVKHAHQTKGFEFRARMKARADENE